MSKVMSGDSAVRIRLTIPEDLFALYEKQSIERGVLVEDLLVERLKQSLGYGAERGVFFNDIQRRELEMLLSANVQDAPDILNRVRRLVMVSVDQVKVQIHPRLLERLKSRCIKQDWTKWLSNVITEQLETFVGMR